MEMKQWTTSIFILSFVCFLKIPIMSSAPPRDSPSSSSTTSTLNPTFLSSLQATSDNFTNPGSSCIFPPRNLFLPQSPYKTLCPNISDLENEKDGSSIMQISEFNNSICLAIRFASAKLCTNDTITTIHNVSLLPLDTDALINSNANSTIESFCEEFEKAVRLRVEDSSKKIDEFFNAFFEKTKPINKNHCSEMCKDTNTSVKINVLCTLANLGFEMIQIQSLNYTVDSTLAIEDKKIENAIGESSTKDKKDKEVPGTNTESKPRSSEIQKPHDDEKPPVSSTITKKSMGEPKSSTNDYRSSVSLPADSNIKLTNNQSENTKNLEDAQPNLVISPEPVEQKKILVDKPSSVPPKSLSFDSSKIQQSDDVKPPVLDTKPSTNTGSANGKPNDSEDLDIGQTDLEAESSENNLPIAELDSDPMSGKTSPDRANGNTIFDKPSKDHSSDQQPQDSSVQKSNGDPNILYIDAPEDEDTGYFGYFITFIGLCGLAFILFHNKKRIIALCIEGRQKPAGRRRSRSGSAAYRKLENNFE